MDQNAIAKSDPPQDIQTHTDALLSNLVLLQRLYPDLSVNWELLRQACIHHDLGKLCSWFQDMMNHIGHHFLGGIPHGLMSIFFINVQAFEDAGFSDSEIKLLFNAVGYHHERAFNYINQELENVMQREIRQHNLLGRYEQFVYPEIQGRQICEEVDRSYFNIGARIQKESPLFFQFIMLKGLLNRLDYAASADIDVEIPNDYLTDSMEALMSKWQKDKPDSHWNDMQCYMRDNQDKNLIVIAQTGMGKTEGALLWLGNDKGLFTLPLKSAINAIYARVCDINKDDLLKQPRVGLLHSDTYSIYMENTEVANESKTESDTVMPLDVYYNQTRQLSLPLTICTIDQLFRFVFFYRGFEERLATLSYSKVVIDEVQMYSPSLVAYLIVGLRYITKMGGKFAIITATLPSIVVDLLKDNLKENKVEWELSKEFYNDLDRHSIKLVKKLINGQDIIDIAQNYKATKILVICNTIKTATAVFKQLQKLYAGENAVDLLHGAFIKRDRSAKENAITEVGAKGSTRQGIWVATQVVEASLNIDFDFLFTELSDLNGLFQRMGRCYRQRERTTDYNCFVFTGGQRQCSGVGAFIDSQVFELSKAALNEGQISEQTKIKMVSEAYTKDNLPEFYEAIKNNIDYIDGIDPYEYSKSEAVEKFRDIHTTPVIPKCVWEQYGDEASKALADLRMNYKGNSLSKGEVREIKAKARTVLSSLMVSLSAYQKKKVTLETVRINDYESLYIAECGYDSEVGIIMPDSSGGDFSDRSF